MILPPLVFPGQTNTDQVCWTGFVDGLSNGCRQFSPRGRTHCGQLRLQVLRDLPHHRNHDRVPPHLTRSHHLHLQEDGAAGNGRVGAGS